MALIAAFASPALAATQASINGDEFGLNLASPNMMAQKKLGTKLMKETLRSVEFTYKYASQGGAIGTIPLLSVSDGLQSHLPKNAIIRNCVIDVVTAPVGTSATIAFGTGQSATDLKAATAITSLTVGLVACIPVGTAGTAIKLTADTSPYITVATTALTAGEIHVIVDYSLSN